MWEWSVFLTTLMQVGVLFVFIVIIVIVAAALAKVIKDMRG